jgi:hypothetical protein
VQRALRQLTKAAELSVLMMAPSHVQHLRNVGYDLDLGSMLALPAFVPAGLVTITTTSDDVTDCIALKCNPCPDEFPGNASVMPHQLQTCSFLHP